MATTYYVSGSGQDSNNGLSPGTAFRNIQKAADLTKPGDTVYVMDGIYTQSDPNRDIVRVTRSGTSTAWITYKAYPGANPKLISKNALAWGIQGASYIIVDGFELQGNNRNVTLEEAIAQRRNLNNPFTSGGGIGILPSQDEAIKPRHVIIRNNKVYEFGGAGIYTRHADYVTIENNTVYNNSWYSPWGTSGISNYQNWNSDGNTGYKMIIRGNTTYNNKNFIPWFVAGKITDGNGIIIDDNRNTQNGSTFGNYRGRTLIENNVSYNNGGRGITVHQSDFVDIHNNTTYQNSQHPDITDGEVSVYNANDVRMFNNIMSAKTGRPVNTIWGATNITSNNNLLHNSSEYDLTGSQDLIGVDPRFVDPVAGNFRLRSDSPAIDRGIRGLTNKDAVGAARPTGNGIDLGALEVVQPSSDLNTIVGTSADNQLTGGNSNDRILGYRGNDQLAGSSGNDVVFGGRGNDTPTGGKGDDILNGGLGNDRFIGGDGRDIFAVRRNEGLDTITDFQPALDRIGLPQGTNLGAVSWVQSGRDTLIKVGTESLALLTGVQASQISLSNFVLSSSFYQVT